MSTSNDTTCTTAILPLTYLAPISHFRYLVNARTVLDVHSHYEKQTFTNRCEIATSQGRQTLSIAVEKHSDKTAIHDIMLSDHGRWPLLHWRAIEAAYNSTAFFEYYRDELQTIFENPPKRLIDFTLKLQNTILSQLEYDNISSSLSDHFIENTKIDEIDLRYLRHPKENCLHLQSITTKPYYQVFENKVGFLPDLSIIDLLFNLGPEARLYLK